LHSKNDEARFKLNFSCSSDAAYNAIWCRVGRYCDYCQLSFIDGFNKASFFLFDQLGVDIDAATKHGIKVARIPGDVTGNAASCAEMAIYLMLGLLRKQV
jgi:hypothetical protein